MGNKNNYKEFKLSSWAIDNSTTVFVIIAILIVGGILSYNMMPRETFPEVEETKIYVSAINPVTLLKTSSVLSRSHWKKNSKISVG